MIPARQRFDFGELMGDFRALAEQLPDKRRGKNTQYKLSGMVMSAFSLFFMQNGSFLAFQRAMQSSRGANNAHTLFGVEAIATDNHIRDMLDAIEADALSGLFACVHGWLRGLRSRDSNHSRGIGLLEHFVLPDGALKGQVGIALDGMTTVSSYEIHCQQCNRHEIAQKGGSRTLFSHACLAPVLVVPGSGHVLSLMPEHIGAQVNAEKQDCELVAAQRWLGRNIGMVRALFAAPLQPGRPHPDNDLQINILGDDLYAHQPFCELLQGMGLHYVLVCKPTSHQTLYEDVTLMQDKHLLLTHSHRDLTGPPAKRYTYHYRYANGLPLRAGKDALLVGWVEVTVTDHKGKQVYHNAFITDHDLSATSVADICALGRARWKVENENHNTLKTKGYNVEHNFGHGKQNLTQTLTSLNILAFLVHTCLALADENYQYLLQRIKSRKALFNHLETLTSFFVYHSWKNLMLFMVQGIEKPHQPNAP